MKRKSKKSSRCFVRQGFTLIEVVAGLGLLGTLLVAILMAHSRHGRQIRSAQLRLDAVEAADRLLSEWSRSPYRLFRRTGGPVPDDQRFRWQVEFLESADTSPMGLRIMRLEVHGTDSRDGQRPLATAELLIPAARPSLEPVR